MWCKKHPKTSFKPHQTLCKIHVWVSGWFKLPFLFRCDCCFWKWAVLRASRAAANTVHAECWRNGLRLGSENKVLSGSKELWSSYAVNLKLFLCNTACFKHLRETGIFKKVKELSWQRHWHLQHFRSLSYIHMYIYMYICFQVSAEGKSRNHFPGKAQLVLWVDDCCRTSK